LTCLHAFASYAAGNRASDFCIGKLQLGISDNGFGLANGSDRSLVLPLTNHRLGGGRPRRDHFAPRFRKLRTRFPNGLPSLREAGFCLVNCFCRGFFAGDGGFVSRLCVIELLAGNKYRVRTARNFRWRRDGPMERLFRTKLLPDFFSREFAGDNESLLLLSGMCTPGSVAILQRKLDELAGEFDALMAQDAPLPAAQRVGVSLVLGKRPWKLKLFDPLRWQA